jgi:hypothetical protein
MTDSILREKMGKAARERVVANWPLICHRIFFRLFNLRIPTGIPDILSLTNQGNTTMAAYGLLYADFM